MDNHWGYSGPSSDDDVAESEPPTDVGGSDNVRLDALRQAQGELWQLLRSEDDPERRMALLSEFSDNRSAIDALTERLTASGDLTAGRPAAYRVELVDPGEEPEPVHRENTDLEADTAADGEVDLEADTAPEEEIDLEPMLDLRGLDADVTPLADPTIERPLDFTAAAAARAASPYGPPPALTSQPPPPLRDDRPEPRRVSGPGPQQIRSTGNRGGPRRPPGPRPPQRPAVPDSPRRAIALLAGLVAVLGVAWILLTGSGDDGTTSAAGDLAATQDTPVPAGPSIADDDAAPVASTVATADQVDQATTESTAETAPVSLDGRAATLQSELNRVVAATPIIFETEETDITELHARILNSVASIVKAYPELQVAVVGFTDDTGTDESNLQISLRRADSVKNYLLTQGVPDANLVTDARGEGTSTGSRALANLERRVEFEVVAPAGAVAAPAAPGEPIRIAVVAPSARNDLAFTQSMVDAVDVIAAERGRVEVAITDNTLVPDEAAAALRDYAAQGYDLVIAHGSQFGAPLLEIAPEFPETAFAWGTASDTFGLPNVYAYDAAAHEGGFVMGAMSTLLSGSGVVGVVGPIEVGDAASYVTGFDVGARASKPDATVHIDFTGSFSDLTLAAETAQGHVDQGADVLTGSAQMVVGAVSVASDSGALWFGTQANQTSLAPSLVVASQVYHWEVILRQIVADIDAGALGGKSYTANLANGGLVIEYNPDYPLPPEVRQRADEVTAGIVDGSIVVPAG